MAGIVVSNFGRAAIATPPSGTGGLTFTVAAGKGALFPSPGGGEYFFGVFTNAAKSVYEIVKVEARSTDSFTIASGGRGQDGTTAQTWLAGDIFYAPWTKGMLEEVPFSIAIKALAALSGTLAADKLAYFTSGVAAALTTLTSFSRTLLASVDATAWLANLGFSTGDAKLTFKNAADAGWVMANDGSIGNAGSGATTRANADTQALYTLLWNNISNTFAPVSGGRGANAAADFTALKTLTLPRTLGRALAVSGAGAGLTARALGEFLGSENAVLVSHSHGGVTGGQSADHTHSGTTSSDGNHAHNVNINVASGGGGFNSLTTSGGPVILSVGDATFQNGAPNVGVTDGQGAHQHTMTTGGASAGHTHSVAAEGVSATGANMPPESFWNVMVKL